MTWVKFEVSGKHESFGGVIQEEGTAWPDVQCVKNEFIWLLAAL